MAVSWVISSFPLLESRAVTPARGSHILRTAGLGPLRGQAPPCASLPLWWLLQGTRPHLPDPAGAGTSCSAPWSICSPSLQPGPSLVLPGASCQSWRAGLALTVHPASPAQGLGSPSPASFATATPAAPVLSRLPAYLPFLPASGTQAPSQPGPVAPAAYPQPTPDSSCLFRTSLGRLAQSIRHESWVPPGLTPVVATRPSFWLWSQDSCGLCDSACLKGSLCHLSAGPLGSNFKHQSQFLALPLSPPGLYVSWEMASHLVRVP